ncbi:hypothetical protein [Sphaerisporangium dianthi]|uniref:Uncharacterized protein n=1 Tax=Sphaerisporangium dianthi TaxID=1436120 RepID=A0ABV9CQB6_9ACTN
MPRTISLSLLGLAALFGAVTLATPASAASPSLSCQVIPSSTGPSTGVCGTFRAASSYVIDNAVQNGPAGGYAWSVPSGTRVVAGCQSTTPFCDLSVRATSVDRDFVTSVAVPGFGVLSVTAVIPAVCGKFLC